MSEIFDSQFRYTIERIHYRADAGAAEPGKVHVVIWPTFAGLTDFEKDFADAVAASGVAATAVDLYGQGRNPVEPEARMEKMRLLLSEQEPLHRLQRELTDSVCHAGTDQVIVHLGFCLGGRLAIEAGLHLSDSAGAVSFHGLMSFYRAESPARVNTQTKILVLNGYSDPLVSDEDALAAKQYWTELGMDWQFIDFGGTVHSFMLPSANAPERGSLYHPLVAKRGYRYLAEFLSEFQTT